MADAPAPAVSVVMIVHNARPYVAEATESILRQTLSEFELVIIDDGSTDGSAAVLGRYAARDERIRLFRRPNRGVAVTRNEGITLSRGRFIAMMDADDIAPPERLERELAFLRTHPDHAAVGGRVLLIDPDGDPIGLWHTIRLRHEDIVEVLLNKLSSFHHGAALFRREALEAAGGYREQFWTSSDYDLVLRLAEQGRLANLPAVMLHYRQHLASLTRTHEEEAKHETLDRIIREARLRRGLPPEPEDPPQPTLPPPPGKYAAYYHYTWAAKAIRAGHFATARKHYAAVLRQAPRYAVRRFISNAWRTLRRRTRK